ncbi:PREDICTED: target of Nesh-SH3 isoform X19 [Chinchilla lanigera]|uniref:target of Nesh-SH3 isoform X19 n=1 Tax=Chinchilla lanigera TaxID=34839 RepID=UPI0006988D09|nr:PREDICTED: target of Nesh-SH3 isoform X19 [Chinchilla lanigera]
MQRPPLPLEDSPLKCGSRAARHPPASLPVGGSKCNMPSSLGCLLLCGSIALALGNAQKLPKGKKPSLKVHINTTSDSILLKFLRPNPNVKLEGFLLGYGSNVSPNQYFPLPTEGKYAEAVVDAEPKYLIVVRPVPPPSQKKSCSGKTRARKPLQLVVGTLSPSSVFLSWGFLINPHHDWTLPSHCPNDRLYTIRYREKDKEKKWIFQLCPATETIVDNLKPNTVYEFGVKDNVEGGIWSKIFNHKTIVGSKNKVNGKIQSTYDQVHTVPAYIPRKLIPVTIIKQVIQNVTHRASTKSPDKTPFGGTILVHFIIPGLNDTSAKLPPSIMLEISDALKAQLAKNETLALPVESKTLEVDKITAQHITVTPETVPRTTKPTMSSTPDISQTALVLSQRTQETLQTILLPKFELPRSTPAPKGLLEFPEAKTSFPFEKFGVTSVTSEKSWMAPAAKTLGDSGVVKPHTATYDVPSSPSTSDEPGISEPPTATSDPTLDSVPPKTSRTLEQPRATLAPSEAPFIPQKVETFTSPAPKPTTHAPQQTTSIPSTPKRRLRPKTPRTKPAPGPQTLPPPQPTKAPPKTKRPGHRPRPKTTRSPGVPKSEPALEAATAHPEPMVPKLAPKPSKRPKTSHRPDVPHMKPDSKPPVQLRPKPQITAHPDTPPTKSALRQTPRTTPKTKTSQHPRIPQTQPVPKGPPRATSRPKTSPSPEVSHTTYGPEDVPFPHEQDPDVSQSEPVLQPVTFRIEPPKTTTAPSETRGIPLIPIISPSLSQEELLPTFEETDQTTQELFTTKIPQELFTTKIPQTTELAKTTQAPRRLYTIPVRPRIPDRPPVRPVLNRTTTKPIRPRPSGIPSRNGVGTGPKQGPKPSGPVRNVSVDSTQATKRPATIPGTRRPPLPPRPVPPRRKPLPPNNVTGKPGSSGIISSHRVTSPPLKATLKPTLTTSERPETDKKQPTAPASGEEFGNTTDFSSSPTRETDHLGKPRFKGPHVRYIPKPESKPCSITDSVQRFPTEEAMEGHATSPPQNPPTNLTVVTVEGCPSFVILDWEKPLNDTVTEYEVISRENGSFSGKNKSIQVTNQTFSTVENLKPDTSYEFQVKPKNPLGEGPASNTVAFSTESADPRVSEPVSAGRDAIWTERPFNSDSYSECKGKQYVKRTWYKKFVGVQLCNSLRYKIYLSDSLTGQFYNIGDQRGHGEDHCQFVDSFLDGRTGQHLSPDQLPTKEGYFRAVRQEPVQFGEIGGHTQINYVQWYECGTTIPGKW